MKHALRKYIAPCGSALFMVVSTMAALIVLVTAMYMSVLSSRQVQYATFDQEQAYVTSTSIGDMAYVEIFKKLGTSDPFVNAMLNLSKGDSISTNGNGYEAFGGTNADDQKLGAIDATVTYVYDIGSQKVYDLAVTVENNNIYETSHTYIKISQGGKTKMRRIDNFFTSTGYLPSDIWIKKVISDSQMYFDNEYVKMSNHMLGSSSEASYNYNITALGSLDIDVGQNMKSEERPDTPMVWAIGNDFTLRRADLNIDLAGTAAKHGQLIVGRNLYIDSGTQNNLSQYTDIYVLGNLYLKSNLNIQGNIYVEGDIIIDREPGTVSGSSEICVNGSVTRTDGNPAQLPTKTTIKSWDKSAIVSTLSEKLNPSSWPVWTVEDVTDKINIDFTKNPGAPVVIDKDGTLGKWTNVSTGDQNYHVILIDTGKKTTDVRTITLSANDPSGKPAFTWNPFFNGTTIVATVGKGSLVVNVPEDVAYQSTKDVFFGNIAWYTTMGGKVALQDGVLKFNDREKVIETADKFLPILSSKDFILAKEDLVKCQNLNSDPDVNKQVNIANGACEYIDVTDEITINGKKETRVHYTCKDHGGWFDCDDESTKACAEIDNYYAGKCDSLCVGLINKSKFDAFYASGDGAQAKSNLLTFYENFYSITESQAEEFLYPNVNIFLASDSENAQIYFGSSKYGDGVRDVYFGYVYAPYMTFSFEGKGAEDVSMRAMGGLVVSDIVLSSGTGFVFAQPDISIPGLVGNKWNLQAFADKTWRMSYGLN